MRLEAICHLKVSRSWSTGTDWIQHCASDMEKNSCQTETQLFFTKLIIAW